MTAHSPFLQQCGFGSAVGASAVCPAQALVVDWQSPNYVVRGAVSFNASGLSASSLMSASFVVPLTQAAESDIQRLIPTVSASFVTSWSQ